MRSQVNPSGRACVGIAILMTVGCACLAHLSAAALGSTCGSSGGECPSLRSEAPIGHAQNATIPGAAWSDSGPNGGPQLALGIAGINRAQSVGPSAAANVSGGQDSVFFGTGASFLNMEDFALDLNGIDWLHNRTYTSLASHGLTWQGESWWSNEMMNIVVTGTEPDDLDVTATLSPHFQLDFHIPELPVLPSDAQHNYPYTIWFETGSDEYVIERIDGTKWVFHDKNATDAEKLKRLEDAYGNDWSVTYSSGELTDIVVDVVAGTDHKITYTYFTSGANDGKLQEIEVYKTTTTTNANLIGKVEYIYHDSTSDDYGYTGDLMKVIVSAKATNDEDDGTLSIQDTYRYRYYKGTYDSSTNPGVNHSLRYVLLPENAERMTDDEGDPDSQTNATWDDYANIIYEYDSNDRVRETQERLPGSGCGCGGASGATTNYTWSTNGGSPGIGTWNIHGVADRADDTRVIFDYDKRFNLLTWVVQDEDDGTPTKELIWHFDYGSSGATENRMTTAYNPSACSAYDESSPYDVTFNASAGVVHTFEYFTGMFSKYKGYLKKIRIKEGNTGTKQTLTQYGRTITARPDLATSIIHYESTGEADGRTTSLAYTFYDSDKVQTKQIETTYPSVSTAKNGPGASAVEKQFFDKRTGALRWTLDGEGYVNFYAYDDETGVRDLTVIDTDTSTLMTVIDDNWDGVSHGGLAADDTVPFSRSGTGTALDIDSSSTIDWLGRIRKSTDAGGRITYYVFKDDETRVYPAWNTSTETTLIPIQVVKTDEDGRVEEELSLKTTFDPNVTSNEPIGTTTYANSDLSKWTVTSYNDSGLVSSTQRYHSIPTSGIGTRYSNYYQTEYEYDSMGRTLYRVEDVADTASAGPPVTYDTEQVTAYTYDFVGRRHAVKRGVSDESHDIDLANLGSLTTLVTILQGYYDDPDVDSIPEHGVGDGNLSWVRRWYGTEPSDYYDFEYRYDWRNRKCLFLPPLAPYSLTAYDHLSRATVHGLYSATTNLDTGDDPATTEASNRISLAKTLYDESGRAYRKETYDDPSDVSPSDALVANTYYDRRGMVWANDVPNSGIAFWEYDGAARLIEMSLGTQFDSAKYTGNAPDYPDDDEGLVEVSEYTLDDLGNRTKAIVKELNHDDTNGMGSSDYVRTYEYLYYNAAHLLTDLVKFGTNNSSGWQDTSTAPTYDNDSGTAGDQPPSRSDTVLVTSYAYNNAGLRDTATDARGTAQKTNYDALGRVIAEIEDDGLNNLNRKTEFEFNAKDRLTRIISDPSADNTFSNGTWSILGSDIDQLTEFAYADLHDCRWNTEVRYPTGDGTVGSAQSDKMVFTFNVDGTVKDRTDQNSTKLSWTYDGVGRKAEEVVTTLGTYSQGATSVDGAIRAITWKYDNEGRVTYATSHTDDVPDTANWTDAANQIRYTYNAAGKLTKEELEVDGAVDGSTLAVEYGYGTDYASGNFHRRTWIEYPSGRKVWNGYTHSGGSSTFQDTINDKFNRVGQLARDSGGSIGDQIAQYDFNGNGRLVRRVHEEDTGKYGNDTKVDLWHGTSGQYAGFDRFGRVVDLRHTDMSDVAFLQREYSYDRNGNRTSIEDSLYQAESFELTYDALNRLTNAEYGILNSSDEVVVSSRYTDYNMDLLGNFTEGLEINSASANVTHYVNAINELTSVSQGIASGPAHVIDEPFDSLGGHWSEETGTWSVSSGTLNADSVSGGEAMLLTEAEFNVATFNVSIDVTGNPNAAKTALVFGHDGNDNYYAVVANGNLTALYQVTSGSWSLLQSGGNSFGGLTVNILGRHVRVIRWSNTTAGLRDVEFTYDMSTRIPEGMVGLYTDTANTKFYHFSVYASTAIDPKSPGVYGLSTTDFVSPGKLEIDNTQKHLGLVRVDDFSDDDYMIQVQAEPQTGQDLIVIYARFADLENHYRVTLYSGIAMDVDVIDKGQVSNLTTVAHGGSTPYAVKIKLSGTSIKVWVDGTLKANLTDSTIAAGGVAFGGDKPLFDELKIGYDNNADDDIDDAGDDLVLNEDFSSESTTIAYDHAGNLIDDGHFVYIYDAWNRLVKVRDKEDSDVVVQEAEFDALGRRIKKTVTNAGDLDSEKRYYYDGQKIIETRNGSNEMVQQFVHGTQYIDELVMVRVAERGELYVHQDANWNVIGMTDLGGSLVERHVYNPYGQFTIDQYTGFGDYDGDGDVDSTDKGTPGTTCATMSGACRILDLDFDGDYDSTDAGYFDSLQQGTQGRPGLTSTNVEQPFAHQGLLFDAELAGYQNRARQYDPGKRRFMQRDPHAVMGTQILARRHYRDGPNHYQYVSSDPLGAVDPTGRYLIIPIACCICAWSNGESSMEQANDAVTDWGNSYTWPPGSTQDYRTCAMDAMQHCVGAAGFANACGGFCADFMGDMNEMFGDNDEMDYHNNDVGIGSGAGSEAEAVAYCQAQLESGGLAVNGDCN